LKVKKFAPFLPFPRTNKRQIEATRSIFGVRQKTGEPDEIQRWETGETSPTAKIPNVCDHFKVKCTNVRGFLEMNGWKF